MKFCNLGNTNISVSKLCLGTMTFGEQVTQEKSFKILDFAYDNGINFFDTAEIYPIRPRKETYGESENIIGNWVKKKRNRNKIVLASKIASCNRSGIGFSELSWIRKGGKNLKYDKKNIHKAIDDSLRRLKTDYIDLYQLHWPERNENVFGNIDYERYNLETMWTLFEEVLENLDTIIKAGKVRYIGVCNETPWGLMKYLNLAEMKSLPRMITIQNEYNLLNRDFDKFLSEISYKEGCGLLAYSPLAGGKLTGKYLNLNKDKNYRYNIFRKKEDGNKIKKQNDMILMLMRIADKYNSKINIFANAFVNSRKFVVSNILGVSSLPQLRQNIKSIDFKFTDEMLKDVNQMCGINT